LVAGKRSNSAGRRIPANKLTLFVPRKILRQGRKPRRRIQKNQQRKRGGKRDETGLILKKKGNWREGTR